jgi:hypothetical protein
MTTAPGVIRDGVLTIEATDYVGSVKVARLVPETDVTSYPVWSSSQTKTDVGNAVWSLELEGVQDHTTGGLAKLLTDNHGVALTFVIAPFNSVGERKATVEVMGQAVEFGGETGALADFSVTLGVIGQPTWADISA